MSKTKVVLWGGTTAGLIGITCGLWGTRTKLRGSFLKWRKERIRRAFYNTLTQEDIAWG